MDRFIEFMSQPIMMEALKAIFYLCIGAVLAMILHDMRADRLERKEALEREREEAQDNGDREQY